MNASINHGEAESYPRRGTPRLLFCGDLSVGSTSEMRCRALEGLGYRVTRVHSSTTLTSGLGSLVTKVAYKCRHPLDWAGANRQIQRIGPHCEIVWIEKGLSIRASTLRKVKASAPQVKILGYSPDDMSVPWNTSRYFLAGLPEYDAYITTKSYGVRELTMLGCPRVVFSPNGYDPALHRPAFAESRGAKLTEIEVGFVGSYEAERARSLERLCGAGIPVSVFGDGWAKMRRPLPEGLNLHGAVMGQSYVDTLCRFKVALGFLRKINRDLQTTRSIEIPACGVFMLAERSDEHRELFTEGVEADFFSTDEELIGKVRHYLADSVSRRRIAAAGRQRTLTGGYSYTRRMRDALVELGVAVPEGARGEVGAIASRV